MEISIEQYNRIQRYLNDEMNAQEEEAFEKELDADQTLKDYYIFETELRDSLEERELKKNIPGLDLENTAGQPGDAPLRSIIAKAGEEWMQVNRKKKDMPVAKKISFGAWITVAAAACIIGVIISVIWVLPVTPGKQTITAVKTDSAAKKDSGEGLTKNSKNEPPEKEKPGNSKIDLAALYKAFFEEDQAPALKPQLLADALTGFSKKDYSILQNTDLSDLPKVRGGPEDINSNQNTREIGHYYKGLSYIETHDLTKATQNLAWVTDSAHNTMLIGKAQWYLALISLKENNKSQSIARLKAIINNPEATPFQKKARELLLMLEK